MKTIPFFVMPGVALAHLREELEITEGDHRTQTMLYRYGQRCGRALVDSYGLECSSLAEAKAVIGPVWMEAGLSRIRVESAEETEMVVNLEESVEAKEGNSCDFARGYLSGIVSQLTSKRFEVDEIECASRGYLSCVLQVYEVVDNLKPSKQAEAQTARKYSLETGYSYLIKEEIPDQSFDIFVDASKHGVPSLCVAREYPEKVKERYGLHGTPFLWLSMDQQKSFSRDPSNLALLYSDIKTFLTENPGSLILLSGTEYLISQNGFPKVLKLLQHLNDRVAVTESTMLVPISPLTLLEQDLKMLEKELRSF
jgi:predicted hydrocarbon binding protein